MTENLFGSDRSVRLGHRSGTWRSCEQARRSRERPGFPVGDDDAIVAVSLPPFQTACPNPFLADWLGGSAER